MAKSNEKLRKTFEMANAAARQEHLGSALKLFRKAHSMDKNNPQIMIRLGHVLLMTGFYDEAIEVLRKAAKKESHNLDTLVLLSQAQLSIGDMNAMHQTLSKALTRDPSNGPALMAKVNAYLDSGMIDEAREVLGAVEDLSDPHVLVSMSRARFMRETKAYGDAVDTYKSVIQANKIAEDHKRSARFELGVTLDKMGEFDRAFACFKQANSGHIVGKMAHLESLQKNWSAEVLAGVPQSKIEDARPVMIAGMPRSGTTLIERVINAHPLGASVGECPLMLQMLNRTLVKNLDQGRIDSYAQEYLDLLDERVDPSAARVIDKHMGSEKDLGLISRVLPGAKVIHALRDPRDCCLSAYFQNFGINVPYSRDLGMLGRQYGVHREMMKYWAEHLEIAVFTNVYEEFVGDPERHTRGMLGFLGMEFDEACLKFYESKEHVHTASSLQVRNPVYTTSTQRWKNYEKHLGPLLEGLGEYADGVMAEQSVWDESGSETR